MTEPGPPRGGLGGRAIEWLWGGAAMAAVRASERAPSARTRELARRGQAAVEVGRLALQPSRPFEHGSVDAPACAVLAQAVHWALLAQRSLAADTAAGNGAAGEAGAAAPPPTEELGSLLADADPELLARAAGSPEAAQALGSEIAGRSFIEYAALPPPEQARLARAMLPFAAALCDQADTARAAVERIWLRRALRVGMLGAAVAVVAWGAAFAADKLEQRRDLARGKPWVASSRYPEFGCTSPAQECAKSDIYFFSTNEEENPSIEWDLGTPQKVSAVRIDNRNDCCIERAVPLVVEVSLDHKTYKEVARRTEEFASWKAQLAPPAQARWVRLRVARRTLLHLTRVRILR